MYLTMNRFKVKPEAAADFEAIWLSRESQLAAVPGFIEFHMLRGPEQEGYRLYSSHTMWESQASFEDWTQSDAFRQAHATVTRPEDGPKPRPLSEMMVGRNEVELFESIQHLKR